MSYNNFIKVINLMASMSSHSHLNLWIFSLEAITKLKGTRLKLLIRSRRWFNQVQKINLQFKHQLKSYLGNPKKISRKWCLESALQNAVVAVLIKELVELHVSFKVKFSLFRKFLLSFRLVYRYLRSRQP